MKRIASLFIVLWMSAFALFAQNNFGENYDENKVPRYYLPQLLTTYGGERITNAAAWEQFRKPEIKAMYSSMVYGRVPGNLQISRVRVHEHNGSALGGLAIRKQIELIFQKDSNELSVFVLMYLPKSTVPVPVFLGYNFYGNQTIADDPNIVMNKSWVRNYEGIVDNFATEKSRGVHKNRWSIERIIREGYGVVTACYADIDPDKNDFSDGIHPFFYVKNQTHPNADEWGAISAWSWGLSRIMDYLVYDKQIDNQKVIVIGHSRHGKAALWAAATDERFAGCISNNSGCMGAALSRRQFGETVEIINSHFPYWFCDTFKRYSNNEAQMPVDQHMLLALLAPRPLYVASATEDLWADPKGEFLAAQEASKVYALYNQKGLEGLQMPAPDRPILGTVSYHIRTGKHDVTDFDWQQYIRFAKMNLK